MIYNIIDEVSSERIEKDITKLVSFGTRHTLSDTISDKRDIDDEYGLISVDFEATFEDGELVLTSKKNLYRIKKEPPSNR